MAFTFQPRSQCMIYKLIPQLNNWSSRHIIFGVHRTIYGDVVDFAGCLRNLVPLGSVLGSVLGSTLGDGEAEGGV